MSILKNFRDLKKYQRRKKNGDANNNYSLIDFFSRVTILKFRVDYFSLTDEFACFLLNYLFVFLSFFILLFNCSCK